MQELTAEGDDDLQEPNIEEIQELQQLVAYQEVGVENLGHTEAEVVEQMTEFDDVEDEETSTSTTTATMEPPSHRPSQPELLDTSEPIIHRRSRGGLTKFVLAIGLWADESGLSRSSYSAL